ncbi:hypothetical protein DICVIV_10474 [Dictyocaulus viviparus]|uniref:Uncharacterized protein n=1 Tax=Dictyocaulus viviparus TaxID=29172 RepID=A0A0D8XI94_DICVI|nr:hypothetical protein DICVIV_10474 [Dictyocaulus viviparus]
MAAARLEEVENRQRTLLANTDNRFSEGIDPVLSLRHSIAAIDARLSSNKATEEEKTDLEKLAKDLRIFLTGLPDDGSNSLLTNTSTGPPTELRVNFDRDVTANVNVETSSGISGTTISTNETSSSSFTTSSCPPAANSTPLADSSNKSKDSQESESINAKETSSTMAI